MRLRLSLWIPRIDKVREHLRDPLFRNAYFLMFSSLTDAGSGFFFWLIAARFYSAEAVGLAAAIIAAMSLIKMFSLLGFDISLVRFLPETEDKSGLINTCFIISFVVALILALIFVAGVDVWSSSLNILKRNKFLFLLFIVFTTLTPLGSLQREGIFVGLRKTEYSFILSIITLIRILFVPFLAAFGAIGIYGIYGFTPVIAFLTGMFFIPRIFTYTLKFSVKKDVIKYILNFSSGNYFARIFEMLPGFLLPIMVINILGSENNAYFYIAWSIAGTISRVPSMATSKSLLAEGLYNREKLVKNTFAASKFIFLLLGIAIIAIFLLGKHLLWLFGENYAENSFELLLLLVIGYVPFSISALYVSIKRVQTEIKPVIGVFSTIAIITLVLSYLLIQKFGLIGIGIAWILANGAVTCGIGLKIIPQFLKS